MVDGGEFAPDYNQQGEIKFEVLLESLRQMEYDAVSIGKREILMQNDKYNAWEKLNASGIPIVTLNIKYKGKRLRDKPIIIDRDGVKIGVFSLFIGDHIPESPKQDWEIEDPEKVIDVALSYARKNSDFIVAMLCGKMPQVRQFVENHEAMDIVIVSHNSTKVTWPEEVNNSLLVSAGTRGKYLGKVDAYLSGGKWRFNAKLFALDNKVAEDPLLAATYSRYQERIKRMTKKSAKKLKKKLEGKFSTVLSATACQSCHEDIYDEWVRTPHAHAIDTLIKKNEQHNPECLLCHTTGYLKGGFISLVTTPQHAGVQCVSCHGQMEGHIGFHSGKLDESQAKTGQSPEVIQDICLKCHTSEQDDNFDFKRDKKKVH